MKEEQSGETKLGFKNETNLHRGIDSQLLREMRLARNETQTRFWGRFGVTQTRGSRFELGQEIPPPVGILIRLYLDGIISDGDLWRARRRHNIQRSRQVSSRAA